MRTVTAILLALAVATPASASDAFKGAGATTCAHYKRAYEKAPETTDAAVFQWVLGYLSAINQESNASGYLDLAPVTPDFVNINMRRYCNSYPDDRLWDVVHAFRYKLLKTVTFKRGSNDDPLMQEFFPMENGQ
jgi:hypothetical protein